jgi:hypothetical protein
LAVTTVLVVPISSPTVPIASEGCSKKPLSFIHSSLKYLVT